MKDFLQDISVPMIMIFIVMIILNLTLATIWFWKHYMGL